MSLLQKVLWDNLAFVPSPYPVYNCHKCHGSGRYYGQSGWVGVCYACEGRKMILSKKDDPSAIKRKEGEHFLRYVHSSSYDREQNTLTVTYIARVKGSEEIAPFEKIYDLTRAKDAGILDVFREIYRISPHKDCVYAY